MIPVDAGSNDADIVSGIYDSEETRVQGDTREHIEPEKDREKIA